MHHTANRLKKNTVPRSMRMAGHEPQSPTNRPSNAYGNQPTSSPHAGRDMKRHPWFWHWEVVRLMCGESDPIHLPSTSQIRDDDMLRFQNRICIQQETTMETGGLEEVPSNLS